MNSRTQNNILQVLSRSGGGQAVFTISWAKLKCGFLDKTYWCYGRQMVCCWSAYAMTFHCESQEIQNTHTLSTHKLDKTDLKFKIVKICTNYSAGDLSSLYTHRPLNLSRMMDEVSLKLWITEDSSAKIQKKTFPTNGFEFTVPDL